MRAAAGTLVVTGVVFVYAWEPTTRLVPGYVDFLTIKKHLLALHNRYAYPLTGLAATLLAIGLGLRPGRKGQLTSALVEGFAIAVAMWAMMVVGKGLALAGHLPIPAAAWIPCGMLMVIAVGLWLKRQGLIGQGG